MGVGFFEGRALQKDDILNTHNTFIPFNLEARECENPLFKSHKEPIIRVILGTNEDAFTQKGIDTFLNTSYKVGSKSDRMAIYAESSKSIEHKKLSRYHLRSCSFWKHTSAKKWYSYHFNGRKTKHRRLYKNRHGYRK